MFEKINVHSKIEDREMSQMFFHSFFYSLIYSQREVHIHNLSFISPMDNERKMSQNSPSLEKKSAQPGLNHFLKVALP